MANKGVGGVQRTSHGIPGHTRHSGTATHHWSYSSMSWSLHPSFRSCKVEHPPQLLLLTSSTPAATLQRLACKWVLCPLPNLSPAHCVTHSSPGCPHHLPTDPRVSPGPTTVHDIEALSSTPTALPLSAQPTAWPQQGFPHGLGRGGWFWGKNRGW